MTATDTTDDGSAAHAARRAKLLRTVRMGDTVMTVHARRLEYTHFKRWSREVQAFWRWLKAGQRNPPGLARAPPDAPNSRVLDRQVPVPTQITDGTSRLMPCLLPARSSHAQARAHAA